MKKAGWELGTVWCGLMHQSVRWPVHGHFQCRTCGRRYPAFPETQSAALARHTASSAGNKLRGGNAKSGLSHITVETRLIGRAELG